MPRPHTIFVCNGDEKTFKKLQKAQTAKQVVSYLSGCAATLTLTRTGTQIYATLIPLNTREGRAAESLLESGTASLDMTIETTTDLHNEEIVQKRWVYWELNYSSLACCRGTLLALYGLKCLADKDGDHAVGENIKLFLL